MRTMTEIAAEGETSVDLKAVMKMSKLHVLVAPNGPPPVRTRMSVISVRYRMLSVSAVLPSVAATCGQIT